MLVPLRLATAASPTAPETPFDMLRDCHGRIRTFLAMGQRLAEADGARDEEVADAARRLVRYFTLGLDKHVADEDLSLAPRLRALPLPPEAREALEAMQAQHRVIDTRVERLVARWRQLEAPAASRPTPLSALREPTETLTQLMETHLQLEERVLFPLASRMLAPQEQQALRAELRARRGMQP
ncbi:hemerythrin domain-containing protein [Pyxidicoccus xibeiensis]|uniref:hemerythrin domain-containing protein n=1 Tax=Pyxidicoccus xibeiensis TaxID=2906759 RepID=UPI0020A7A3EA|nr:hemerythrin domain-containing protein [Pyxidicoccus xibeiensis]MCP3138203.1 hemerythrin domain-containing protein [Pyxidicoccus xibeiensis]